MINSQKEVLNNSRQVGKPIAINPRVFILSLVILSGILSSAFIFLSIYTGISSFFLLAAGFTLTTLLGLLAITKFWLAPDSIKLLIFALLFELSIIFNVNCAAVIFRISLLYNRANCCISHYNVLCNISKYRLGYLDWSPGGNRIDLV